jgi:hypothetical protein
VMKQSWKCRRSRPATIPRLSMILGTAMVGTMPPRGAMNCGQDLRIKAAATNHAVKDDAAWCISGGVCILVVVADTVLAEGVQLQWGHGLR